MLAERLFDNYIGVIPARVISPKTGSDGSIKQVPGNTLETL
jgi:hypothetical protein